MAEQFKMMETSLKGDVPFHDDMIDNKQVKIKEFTFSKVFDDFRIFNGIKLSDMDFLLVQLSAIMNLIKSQDVKTFKSKAIEKINSYLREGLEIEWMNKNYGDKRNYRIVQKFTAEWGVNISLAIATIENLIELFDLKDEDFK